jgi:rubrerythrin
MEILGMVDYVNPYILKLIIDAIDDEIADGMTYSAMAKSCKDKEMFEAIANDEAKHKKMLVELYTELAGKPPTEKRGDNSRDEGLSCDELIKRQLSGELEGVGLYRTIYFAMTSPAYKNIIFEIMSDELMHAIMLSSIYPSK